MSVEYRKTIVCYGVLWRSVSRGQKFVSEMYIADGRAIETIGVNRLRWPRSALCKLDKLA